MAETVKHTPAPWHPGHLGSDSDCQCANIVDEGYAGGICTVHVGNGKPVGDGGNDAPPLEEAIANMHLIAAAPDLLQALLPFAKVYEKDISVDEDDADLFQVMLSHNRAPKLTVGDFRRAFQAVFEAEGRS